METRTETEMTGAFDLASPAETFIVNVWTVPTFPSHASMAIL
jgi:hypothetical protein